MYAFFDGIHLMLELLGDLSIFEKDWDFRIFEIRYDSRTEGIAYFGDPAVAGVIGSIQWLDLEYFSFGFIWFLVHVVHMEKSGEEMDF